MTYPNFFHLALCVTCEAKMLFLKDSDIGSAIKTEYKRLNVDYKNRSDRFLCKKRDFTKQFAHIYASRLQTMKKLLAPKIAQKWGNKFPIKQLFELNEDNPQKCIIIGFFFKHQQLKPSVLRDISEENQLAPQPRAKNFADDSDEVILEDELQQIRLIGAIDVHHVVTGICTAVLGYEGCDGKFEVEEYIYYEGGPQKSLRLLSDSPLLVIVSGLDFEHDQNELDISLDLLKYWIFGNLESNSDDKKDWEAACIVRIIFAGNSFNASDAEKSNLFLSNKVQEHCETLDAIKKIDAHLSSLSHSVCVDLMPGEYDPTNSMLPQQPFHPCLFPSSRTLKSFQSVPNPYAFEIAGRFVIGTSGQNVEDIIRYSKIDNPLEALRATLQWSHLFPTGPDTLPCYPYYDSDPFIIDETPHIYFAGNCDEFQTSVHKGSDGQVTRLVCVPSYAKTQTAAVINLRTLDAHKISFKINDFSNMED